MPLINCIINLILLWPTNFVISSAAGATKFSTANKKLYVPVNYPNSWNQISKDKLAQLNVNQKYY